MAIIKATNVRVTYNDKELLLDETGAELPVGEASAAAFEVGQQMAREFTIGFTVDAVALARFWMGLRLARFLPLSLAAWLADHWPAALLPQRVTVWFEERQLEIGTALLKYWRFIRRRFRLERTD